MPDVLQQIAGSVNRNVGQGLGPDGLKRLSVERFFFLSDSLALLLSFGFGGALAWGMRSLLFKEKLIDFIRAVTLDQVVLYFVLGALALLWLDVKAHYRQRLPLWEQVGHILFLGFAGLLLGGFVQFAAKNLYSRLWLGFSWGVFTFLLLGGRVLTRRLLEKTGMWRLPAVMIGNGPCGEAALQALKSDPSMGYDIVQVTPAEHLMAFKGPDAWLAFLKNSGASFLFLALDGADVDRLVPQIRLLARERIPFALIPPWRGLPLSALSTHHFVMRDVLLMHDSNRLTLPMARLLKRSFDVIVSVFALVFLSPFILPLIWFIRRDGGPALFAQKRVGKDGRLFPCYKWRTMRVGAEEELEAFLEQNPDMAQEWDTYQKLKQDPRITKIGRGLRKTSFDEVPQLFNVLMGDMSLVGPRPILPGQKDSYGDDLVLYTSVRPGITGPWQVSGRNRLTFSQRVALESWYARNWTFWLDVVILLKTPAALLSGEKETG